MKSVFAAVFGRLKLFIVLRGKFSRFCGAKNCRKANLRISCGKIAHTENKGAPPRVPPKAQRGGVIYRGETKNELQKLRKSGRRYDGLPQLRRGNLRKLRGADGQDLPVLLFHSRLQSLKQKSGACPLRGAGAALFLPRFFRVFSFRRRNGRKESRRIQRAGSAELFFMILRSLRSRRFPRFPHFPRRKRPRAFFRSAALRTSSALPPCSPQAGPARGRGIFPPAQRL